jgi:dTDP-4-dehydrorhamnose reductase
MPVTLSAGERARVLVTGASGQLGAVVVAQLVAGGHEVTPAARADLDIRSHADVMRAVTTLRPHVVVNCAAYNDVDGAEDRYQTAFDVNAFAVRSLARAAQTAGAVLVHYSTDFVFDGESARPYTEDDRPRPQSVYASSKFLGECFARDAGRYYVLRVESLFGGPAARSSIDRIIDSLAAGRPARAFVDRVVSPSYVEDVSRATLALVAHDASPGVYHCVNSGYATWFTLARHLAGRLGVDAGLVAGVSVADIALRASRPRFAALDNTRIVAAGAVMPSWQDAVERHLAFRRARLPQA